MKRVFVPSNGVEDWKSSSGGAAGDGLGDFVSDSLRDEPEEMRRIGAMQAEFELALPLNACPMISIRYRCLALVAAKKFGAETALMLIHSFSTASSGFEDFRRFASLPGHDRQDPARLSERPLHRLAPQRSEKRLLSRIRLT